MSKKDKSQVVDPMTSEVDAEQTAAEKLEAFKQAKREAAKRHAEKVANEKVERREKCAAIIDYMKSQGYWDGMAEDLKQFLVNQSTAASSVTGNNQSTFVKIFGSNPTVGQSISLMEVFQKTLKGKSAIDHSVKQWAEKGIIVSFAENKDNIFDSVYKIESLTAEAAASAE